jgi:hypothetical protein
VWIGEAQTLSFSDQRKRRKSYSFSNGPGAQKHQSKLIMKTQIISLIGAAIITLLGGCVSGATALKPVGPDATSSVEANPQGRLQVYTPTQVAEDFLRGNFTQLMAYDIRNESGKRLMFVANQASGVEESPDQVMLPTGKYTIVADSADYGLVTVPMVIQSGKTTTVHLDGDPRTPLPLFPRRPAPLPDTQTAG